MLLENPMSAISRSQFSSITLCADDIDVSNTQKTLNENNQAQIHSDEEPADRGMDVDVSDADEEDNAEEQEDDDDDDDDDEHSSRRREAISQLENMALSFLSQLTESFRLESMKQRGEVDEALGSLPKRGMKKVTLELANRRASLDGTARTRLVRFPRNLKASCARGPAQLLRVVDEAHEALLNEAPITKRDLYYKDVPLFKKQSTVDNIVDDLAATLALNRSDLNIRASSKGLYCGSALTIHLNDGSILAGNDSEALLVPAAQDIERFEINDNIAWILVVEKDAVFQTLRHARLTHHPSLHGPGLLITGKGYPDVATRQLVKSLSDNLPGRIPILALVDADAYGIDIVSVYKYGSASMYHENESLAAGRVEWIGVSASEALSMGVDRDAFLPMSTHDSQKALALLRSRRDIPSPWKRELMQMLHTRKKAEIEILSNLSRQRTSTFSQNADYSDSDALSAKKPCSPLLRYLIWKINNALEN